ncbi:hypothetical protein H6P81_010453 [Aristolochia fimbriata]|uniref:Uncharacterized protein n=1 Tax=Aristolochia fimbriata TaxID=158543 RepID=A0AAV7ENT6_ARIFI|nr:hypothetical protein H6P81_010453 [Aristolochia fimbriata]
MVALWTSTMDVIMMITWHEVEKLSVSSARNIFERLVKDDTDTVDVVRVFVLIVFLDFLFVSTNGGLNKPFFTFIGDVHLLGTYAWAPAVHRYLVDSANNCATHSKARSSSVTHYVGRCTPAMVGWFKEATTGHEPTSPQGYPRLFRWEGKNFNRRGSVGKVWRRHGYQVRLLEPETPVEEELLVVQHQSNARCNHEESEHLKQRISNLEVELANFRSTVDDWFKEMEARFVSPFTMHPHSSNLNVEIHGHSDREDHSWGNSGGIGVPEDVSVDVAEKSHEGWETSAIDERTNNEREKVTGEDEGNNNPGLSSIVRGVKEQRRKRKDGPQLKPPFAKYERKKVVKEK